MTITKLRIGDFVEIENRIFQVVYTTGSNGFMKWKIPTIKVYRYNTAIPKKLAKIDKEVLDYIINNTELNKEDYPINENDIKPKNIFKKEYERG